MICPWWFVRRMRRAARPAAKAWAAAWVVWVVLTTVVPQWAEERVLPSVALLPADLVDTLVLFVIAHPDDEVMFFGPTLAEVAAAKHGNSVYVLCLSTGNGAGLGAVRAAELVRSVEIMAPAPAPAASWLRLPPPQVTVLDDPRFQDGMDQDWDVAAVAAVVAAHAARIGSPTIVTFDHHGVSHHPNHIAVAAGAAVWADGGLPVYALVSLPWWNKYLGVVHTVVDLVRGGDGVRVFSLLNQVVATLAAMALGHYSQMVWFRWGWLAVSRYVNYNELVRVA